MNEQKNSAELKKFVRYNLKDRHHLTYR